MEPTNDVREALAEAMADTLVRSNPGVAKDFCLKAGLDFDITVATYLAEAHEAGMCDHTLRQTLRQILELCTNRDWVITEAHQWPLTEHTIGFLAQVLPDVLTVRREELLDWLLSDEGRWMGEVRSFLSAGEVIGRLNQDPRIRNLPRAELTEKVGIAVSLSDSRCENPGLEPELWRAYAVGKVLRFQDQLTAVTGADPIRSLWEALEPQEAALVVREAIQSLMSEEKYTEAARLADWAGLDGLKVQAAAAAYDRCCGITYRNQWPEAARLARYYGLYDSHGAALKELKRLEAGGDPIEVVRWARDYNLPVSAESARAYFDCRSRRGYQGEPAVTLLLIAGETELAREEIVETWEELCARALGNPNYVKPLDYYRQPGGVFSGDDAIADLSVILAALGEQEAESQFLSLLETLGLADVKPAIVSQAVKEIISDRAKTEAERFVADHFPCSRAALSVTALSEIAERVAVEQARKRDWRGFLRLCQEWELATLLAIVADLEKLLPEEERPTEPPGDRFARAAGISV